MLNFSLFENYLQLIMLIVQFCSSMGKLRKFMWHLARRVALWCKLDTDLVGVILRLNLLVSGCPSHCRPPRSLHSQPLISTFPSKWCSLYGKLFLAPQKAIFWYKVWTGNAPGRYMAFTTVLVCEQNPYQVWFLSDAKAIQCEQRLILCLPYILCTVF